jgi:hypothetical protein
MGFTHGYSYLAASRPERLGSPIRRPSAALPAKKPLQPHPEIQDFREKIIMSARLHKTGLYATLLLLTGMAVIAGCVSFDSKDMQWAVGQTVGLPAKTGLKIGNASLVYRQCSGRWPASLEELRSTNCADADKRQEISNYLADIPWEAITNVALGTTSDGKLTMLLGFAPQDGSDQRYGNGMERGGAIWQRWMFHWKGQM